MAGAVHPERVRMKIIQAQDKSVHARVIPRLDEGQANFKVLKLLFG